MSDGVSRPKGALCEGPASALAALGSLYGRFGTRSGSALCAPSGCTSIASHGCFSASSGAAERSQLGSGDADSKCEDALTDIRSFGSVMSSWRRKSMPVTT